MFKHKEKVKITGNADRLKTNEGLYAKLVVNVEYVVIAKNGSIIPCVAVGQFAVVSPGLPDVMKTMRFCEAHTLQGKFDHGWRFSHGNDKDNLPEFNLWGKQFANNRNDQRSDDDHKMQQFQEYDVNNLLGPGGTTKEVDDVGAMRLIVDECFQHVYFCSEHYRPMVDGKITAKQKKRQQDLEGFNPFIFVLFEPPPNAVVAPVQESKKERKKETGPSEADLLFAETNIIETKEASVKKLKINFKGKPVQVIQPQAQRRGRSGSFVLPPPVVAPVVPAVLPVLAPVVVPVVVPLVAPVVVLAPIVAPGPPSTG